MKHFIPIWACSLLLLLCLSCASDTDVPSSPENTAPNTLMADTGKADSTPYSVVDHFLHNRTLPTDDLSKRLAVLATSELNSALSANPYVNIAIGVPRFFGLEAGSQSGVPIESLPQLLSGLMARYGETDFATSINNVRREHLANSGDVVFAETDFQVQLTAQGGFSIEPGDFDVDLGFSPGRRLVARTVTAHSNVLQTLVEAPLRAAYEARGFILPRGVEDFAALDPGESISLEGEGVVGYNVGANLPIFSFDPIDYLVMTSRFHIGARVSSEGGIDVQIIRGKASDLFIDIGLSNERSRSFRVALESGYGLHGIPPLLEVNIAGNSFSLGAIAERLISNRIDRLGLLSYGIESVSSRQNQRATLQRYHIDLSQVSPDLEAGIKQAVTGDLRLIQTLADRAEPGLAELVSMERDINRKSGRFGAHLSSMRFFAETTETEGSVTLSSGDVAQELIFRDFQRRFGRFFTEWGYRRQMVTSQTWEGGEFKDATVNLRLAVNEGDDYTERDQILDHVDCALVGLVEFEQAYHVLTRVFEVLQHEVDKTCERCNSGDDRACRSRRARCMSDLITDEDIRIWKNNLATLIEDTAASVDDSMFLPEFNGGQALVRQLLELKLSLSSVNEIAALLQDSTGETSILSDARYSQAGLNFLFNKVTPEMFDARLREMLTLIISKRDRDHDSKFTRVERDLDRASDKIDDMVNIFVRGQEAYRKLDTISNTRIAGLPIGDGAFVLSGFIEVDEDDDETVSPVLHSIAEQKGIVAADMIQGLIDRGRELNFLQSIFRLLTLGLANPRSFESHHLVAYTINSLIPVEHREWLLTMNFEEEPFSDVQLYTRGVAQDGLIEAGEYDLNFLFDPNR